MTDSNGLEYTQNDDCTRTYRINLADEAKLPLHVAGGSLALIFDGGELAKSKMFLEEKKEWALVKEKQ